MAKVCQITGKRTRTGNNVSHANNKTKRKFYPNLQKKRFFVESTGEWITLKVATSAIKTINKNGLEATLQKAYRARYAVGIVFHKIFHRASSARRRLFVFTVHSLTRKS